MYTTSDLKRGLILELDGAPHIVEAIQTSSPTARGASTIHKVKLRNLKSKQRVERSFRGGDTFQVPDVQHCPVDFLYDDPQAIHFMDTQSYEQFAIDRADLEWESKFLHDGIQGLRVLYYNEAPIGLELPPTLALEITETTPAVKGSSASGLTKAATLSTGHVVQVPEHIDQNVMINVDTRTGEFLGRAKD
jgi:elongation factor P